MIAQRRKISINILPYCCRLVDPMFLSILNTSSADVPLLACRCQSQAAFDPVRDSLAGERHQVIITAAHRNRILAIGGVTAVTGGHAHFFLTIVQHLIFCENPTKVYTPSLHYSPQQNDII